MSAMERTAETAPAAMPVPATAATPAPPGPPPITPPATEEIDLADRTIEPGSDIPKYSVWSHASNVPGLPISEGTRVVR